MTTAPPVICTIVTASYWNYAATLAASLERHMPDHHLEVLVVDGSEALRHLGSIPTNIHLTSLEELNISNLAGFCFQYNTFELCNALKPYLLRFLRQRRGVARVLYLDSDTWVTGNLGGLFDELRDVSVLLTPHAEGSAAVRAECLPDSVFLRTGVFNAGVLGVGDSPEAEDFLLWWCHKLRHGCLDAPHEGIYVDQKYLDLVPALFPNCKVLRMKGVNIAWFNLECYNIRRTFSTWLADDEPLLIFHFTKLDPLKRRFPWESVDKLVLRGDTATLIEEYSAELLNSRYADTRHLICRWTVFRNGMRIDSRVQSTFREAFMKDCNIRDPYTDPQWENLQTRITSFSAKARRRLHRIVDAVTT